jgi:hypothetical protein
VFGQLSLGVLVDLSFSLLPFCLEEEDEEEGKAGQVDSR